MAGNRGDSDVERVVETLEAMGPLAALDPLATVQPTHLASALEDTLAAPSTGDVAAGGGPRTVDLSSLPPIGFADRAAGQLADLELRGELGRGGMGVVELAVQRSLQREVAVKRVRRDGPVDRAAHALLAEAVFTGYLEHPSIVPVHALGRDADGAPVMVMKKLEGARWLDLLEDPSHPGWGRVRGDRLAYHVGVAIELCHALEYAHARGVLHRDVKPENVFVGPFGEVYLLDWGLGLRVDEAARLPADAIAGTPSYMAPEMLHPAAGRIGPATDVYLLAASLFHALAGRPPHEGPNVYAILAKVLEPDLPTLPEGAPEELQAICRTAMAPSLVDRYPSAEALRRALEDFLTHRASVELARAAEERLGFLRSAVVPEVGTDPVRVHALFDGARFGFERALDGWAENGRAREGLREALVLMAGWEIGQRNAPSARALLVELADPPAPLEADLARLEQAIAADGAERERLRAMEADLDPAVSLAQRRRATLILGGLAFVFVAGLLTTQVLGLGPPPLALMVAATFGFALSVCAILYAFRAVFFRNRYNRQVSLFLVGAGFGVAVHRLHAFVLDQPIAEVVSGDLVVASVAAALASAAFGARFAPPAAICLAGAFASALLPSLAIPVVALAALVSVGWFVFLALRGGPSEPVEGAAGQPRT